MLTLGNRYVDNFRSKEGTIAKQNNTEYWLMTTNEIDGVTNMDEVIINDALIQRHTSWLSSLSCYVEKQFNDTFELIYFHNRLACYFKHHPSNWTMRYIVNYQIKSKKSM